MFPRDPSLLQELPLSRAKIPSPQALGTAWPSKNSATGSVRGRNADVTSTSYQFGVMRAGHS